MMEWDIPNMNAWVFWSVAVIGFLVIAGGVIVALQAMGGSRKQLLIASLFALVLGTTAFVSVLTVNAMTEPDDLMDRLGSERHGFVVVSADEEEVCGVLDGDNDVVCVTDGRILNYEEEEFDASAVIPIRGDSFSLLKLTVYGSEGVLFYGPR